MYCFFNLNWVFKFVCATDDLATKFFRTKYNNCPVLYNAAHDELFVSWNRVDEWYYGCVMSIIAILVWVIWYYSWINLCVGHTRQWQWPTTIFYNNIYYSSWSTAVYNVCVSHNTLSVIEFLVSLFWMDPTHTESAQCVRQTIAEIQSQSGIWCKIAPKQWQVLASAPRQ